MNTKMIRTAAALACSLMTLSALGITASAQTPVPADPDIESMMNLVEGKTNIIAGTVEAAPGETVTYPVYIANNSEPGFTATGIRLFYDAALSPCTDANGKLIVNENCTASDALYKSFALHADSNLIGFGSMGLAGETDNGLLYTVEIQVPADAQPGDVYEMNLDVDKFLDVNVNPLEYVAIDGSITVSGQAVQPEEPAEPTEPTTPEQPDEPAGHHEHGHKDIKDKKDKKGKKDKKNKNHGCNYGYYYFW